MEGVTVHRGSAQRGMVINLGHSLTNPVDSSTYYWGDAEGLAASGAAGAARAIVMVAGVITAVTINAIVFSVLGSAESVSYYLRVNNTTDYLISSTVSLNTLQQTISISGLSVVVAPGDYFEIKVVTPAWVTNPAGVVHSAMVLIE